MVRKLYSVSKDTNPPRGTMKKMLSHFHQPLALLASYLTLLSPNKIIQPALPLSTGPSPPSTTPAKVFDLSGANWSLTSPGNESFKQVAGKVPSQAHLDLYAAGVIPDPYSGLNDFELRWVSRSNWSYTAEVMGL
jgi:hypothetical protein